MNCKSLILAAIVAAPLLVASQSHAASRVDLGAAGNFTILAKTGISTTGVTTIVGDIGVSPIFATGLTGFGQVLPAGGTFSTSALVTGRVFAADYALPTPTNLTTAVSDMEAAYTDAAGRAAGVTELGTGNIGGLTLAPGVYKWTTGVTIPTDVTLSGGPTGVWIFQIAGTLSIATATDVILSGGAKSKNIFWQVAGDVTLGEMSNFKGVILGKTLIAFNNGATLDGKALAQTAVTLIGNAITGQPVATLVDGTFSIVSSNDPINNVCEVGVSGADFQASGDVTGVGTAAEVVVISYATPRPTSTTRSATKLSVKQRTLSTLNVLFDDVTGTAGPVVIEKCAISGSANAAKLTGSVSVNCKTDSLLALLTAAQITSVKTAFSGNSKVKFKTHSSNTKGTLTIKCSGDATTD